MKNEAQAHVDGMSDDDLDNLIVVLGNYSKSRCWELKWIWRSGNSQDLPKAEDPQSIVSLAFKRVLTPHSEKGRKWNPETHPDFQGYMMDVIDSILDEFANCLDNKIITNISPDASLDAIVPVDIIKPQGIKKEENHKTGRREQAGDWLNRQPSTPDDDLKNKETTELEEIYLNKLAQAISDDEELVSINQAIREGCDSNQEISDFTKLEIKNVENAKKRLKTQVKKLNKEFIKADRSVTATLRR